ncbi:probable G-protein coupled receptor 139 [Carcharodon carcharias]|uniref:probable G-protein coupled receptor 139 n=1 Tax=Carcharodon carcharias TaxID=13397 RepID=UPI001B7E54FD|nr:probable G-protein coupled receptor 139 [Carcharodon carcharias]
MDDVTVFCSDQLSVHSLINICDQFKPASGTKVNREESTQCQGTKQEGCLYPELAIRMSMKDVVLELGDLEAGRVITDANIMTIMILSRGKCGLSKCISVYMVAMATANLLVMTFNVIIYLIFNYHFPYSFLSYTAACKLLLYITFVNLDMSVWFTVFFTFDRYVAICRQEFKGKYCNKRIATTVIVMASILSFIKGVPMFFSYEAERVINNVHWGCRSTLAVYTLPAWSVYSWMQSTSVVLLPFTLLVLFNSLTVGRILLANRVRSRLLGNSIESQRDPEVMNRRKSIILLFSVSGSFILLWLTAFGSFAATRLSNSVYYQGDYSNPRYIATETGYLFSNLSSCTNTCIYAVTQRKFREELTTVLKAPWAQILELLNYKKRF